MLNNDDKKYLKENIEKRLDNLDKKVGNVSKSKDSANIDTSTPSGKRLNELLSQDREKENRKQLLAELQKKNENGEATLAQKIEMMNLSLKTAIPDDFKEAVKDSGKILKDVGKDVQRGTNRALGGVDSIITRMMGMNPLTAMLWSAGKDITRDLWNIGAGAAQAGWGIAKGVGRGAVNIGKGVGSIFNSAVNLFKPKPKKEDVPEDEKQVEGSRLLLESGEEFEEKDAEKSTAQKIDEIHQAFFKDFKKHLNDSEKNEKSRISILSKGLSGIGKSMQAVSGIVNTIMAKQKLILGGLMLGALGILALVGWFKNGGLENALNGVKNNILKSFASEGGQQARENADKYLQEQYDKIKADAQDFDNMNKNMNLSNGSDFSKASYITKQGGPDAKTLRTQDLQNALQKEGFTKDRAIKTTQAVGYGMVSAKYKNIGASKPWVLKLPFETWIGGGSDIIQIDGDDIHVDFVLSRGKGKNTKGVIFTNAVKSSVKSGTFKPNTQIAVLDINSRLIGDWESFCGLKEGQSYEDVLLNERAQEIEKNYNKIADEPYHTPGLGDALSREADKRLGVYRKISAKDIKNKSLLDKNGKVIKNQMQETSPIVNEKSNNQQVEEPKVTTTQVPNNNYNQGNTNDNKVQKQKDELAAQKKAEQERLNKDIEKGLSESPYESKPQNVSLNVSQNTPSQAAEIFNIGQYDAATS